MTERRNICWCGLPLRVPVGLVYYRPGGDPEPPFHVRTMVRWGDRAYQRRWDRTGEGLWLQHGSMVDGFPPRADDETEWVDLGLCFARYNHVLVPVRRVGSEWENYPPPS